MEFQKIVNLLDTTSDEKDLPTFVTKKWIVVYDQPGKNCNVSKEIRIKTPMLRSDLCHFSDAYIVVKGTITVTDTDNAKRNKVVAFKNKAPFINYISKINGVQIDNAEDLGATKQFSWIQHILKKSNREFEPINPLYSNSESFKYKASITGNTYNLDVGDSGYDATKVGKNETEVVIPLKHLSNFWRSLNIPLINFEIELILIWSKNCI